MPTRLLSSVLLPAPLGPITATISDGPTAIETSRITGTPPYPDVIPSARRLGAGRSAAGAACLSNKVSVDNLSLPPQAGHGPAADQLPLSHHEHRVAELLDQVELVLHHQDCEPVGAQRLEVVLDLPHDARVHAGHRLVEQKAPRVKHQGPHDLDQPF